MKEELKRADEAVAALKEECSSLCMDIHEHPELGFQEFRSSAKLCDYLEQHGFQTEKACAGMETAFRAVCDSGKPGPSVGLICEYDALPGLGHACGHNIIGTASATAAIAASKVLDMTGGKITVLGTPCEEGSGGGKIRLLEAGYFDGLDCAFMFHPGPKTVLMEPTMAISEIKIRFHGKAAHAAASPHTGVSALEAVVQLFVNVNGMRVHLKPDIRMNGIITKGGSAANIIPDLCEAEFSVRALSGTVLDEATERLKHCAEAAALASGCTVEFESVGLPYKEMQPNRILVETLAESMELLGIPIEAKISDRAMASTDMGNISQALPAFHAMIAIGKAAIPHTPAFAEATAGENGASVAVQAARALAVTAARLLAEPDILRKARESFEENRSNPSA